MTTLRRAALVLAAAAGALATPAEAYVRSTSAKNGVPLFWPQPAVQYVLSSHAASLAPSCGDPTGDGPALDAVRASFGAWQQSCSALQLVYGGRLDDVRIGLGTDGEHLVVFRRGFCSTVAPTCMQDPNADCASQFDCFEDRGGATKSVVALTSVLYDENSGRIVDADIEVNAWDGQGAGQAISGTGGAVHGWYFTCDKPASWPGCQTLGQDGCYYMDLQNTVTHEVGHFVGLAHVCEPAQGRPCSQADNQITMSPTTFPGDVEKRTLAQDDVDGVCAMYPPHSGGGGGCASGGGTPAATALLLAAAALWRRRVVRLRAR